MKHTEGRVAVITGAVSGFGLEAARIAAEKKAAEEKAAAEADDEAAEDLSGADGMTVLFA